MKGKDENINLYDADGNKLKVEHKLLSVSFLKENDNTPDSRATIIRPPKVITTLKMQYSDGHIYRNGELQQVNNDYGYWADSTYHYYVKDYQGNVRAVIAQDGTLEEINNYYPYGSLMGASTPGVQPFKYGAKELDRQNGINIYDSQARFYDPIICRTTTQDPLAEKYYSTSPYLWCAGNPMKYVDEDGRDWYSYNYVYKDENGKEISETKYAYTTCTSQEELNEAGIDGSYIGKIVVFFNGFYDEHLGKNNSIDDPSSKTAIATVYGKDGKDDVSEYTAFTMSSDFKKYGAIKDGIYFGKWRSYAGKGIIPKHYILNDGNAIDTVDGNRYENGYSKTQKNGICIHRTNNNGTAGGKVSLGCLLILAKQWNDFENKVGKGNFTVILQRK